MQRRNECYTAPTSAPFSNTTTLNSLPRSCSSCLRRMAALRPAGPPPTMHTSTSSEIRSTANGSNSSLRLTVDTCNVLSVRGATTSRRVQASIVAESYLLVVVSNERLSLQLVADRPTATCLDFTNSHAMTPLPSVNPNFGS